MIATILASLAAGRHARAELSATVPSPAPGQRLRREVVVHVQVTSDAPFTAHAELEGRRVRMECLDDVCTTVRASFDLAGLAEGTKAVAIDVSNTSGERVHRVAPFIYDRPAELALSRPVAWQVARPTIAVRGTCSDSGRPCSSVEIWGPWPVPLATFGEGGTFETTLDLSRWEGQSIGITAVGRDPYPEGEDQDTRTVIVDSSARLREVFAAEGPVSDFDGRRVLYLDPSGMHIYDRSTAGYRLLDATPGYGGSAQLTTRGAAWVRHNTEIAIWTPSRTWVVPAEAAVWVAGRYVSWQTSNDYRPPFVVHWLDVESGVETTIRDAGFGVPAPNGVLFYVRRNDAFDVVRRDGAGDRVLTARASVASTDGELALMDPFDRCQLELYGPTGLIDPLGDACVHHGVVAHGWVAFVRTGSGPSTVWVRAPDGTQTLLATSAELPHVTDVSPAGEVMYALTSGFFRASRGTTPDRIASPHGRAAWRDGHWWLLIGNGVFGIDEVPPPPDPGDDPDAGVPDANIADAGAPDAAIADAGAPDAAIADAGAPDAALADAGMPDAAVPDAAIADASALDAASPDPPGDGCGGCASSAPGALMPVLAWLLWRARVRRRTRRMRAP
jgi:hypothetical protein